MAYSIPAGNAAHFVATGTTKFPVGYNDLNFTMASAAYTAPAGNAVNPQFPADVANGYTPPAGDAADFVGAGSATFEAVGAATITITAEGYATHNPPAAFGFGEAYVDITAAGVVGHGVAGSGSAIIDISAASVVGHGVAGTEAANVSITAAGVGLVERYELTGEVRFQGVLVNRTVRAYRRDTGALVGEQATVGGRFKIHAGFAEREHYLIPVDLEDMAKDFVPPCANRVVSILAMDAA